MMKVKEESENVGLKLNTQKTKIMASSPITSWQIDGETIETVTDFIFLGSKVFEHGDCSHEIKKRLPLGRKVMTNLDCQEPAWGTPPMAKVMRKKAQQNAKAWSGFRGSPWVFLNIYPPKPESACLIAYKKNASQSEPPLDGSLTCLTGSPGLMDLYNLWIAYSPPTARGTKLKAS